MWAYATFAAVAGVHTAVYSGPPDTTITASPAATIATTSGSFSFIATPAAGATFQCSLDGAAFATCTSPRNHTGLALGAPFFEVRGANLAGADATPASTTFTVLAPDTNITANPGATTASSTTTFSFVATPSAGSSFECALDNAAFAACTSPKTYSGITVGSHTLRVRAVAPAGTDPTPASHTWVMTALVAAFGFEEAVGTTTDDSSGLGNTGTLSNAARAATGSGHALSFNGNDAWVTVADSTPST